ncbi:MAG: signal peptidase II [Candidatus Thiodiazotropha sp.]
MNKFSRLAVLVITILISVGFDQITKLAAQNTLRGHASISLFDNIFHLVYAENAGSMLGVGSTLPDNMRFVLFVLFVGIVLIAAVVFVLVKPLRNVTVLAISLIVGGGIGNLVDRLIRDGSVIDFMLIKIGTLETGIFNVADIAITLGVCMMCILLIRLKGKKDSHTPSSRL